MPRIILKLEIMNRAPATPLENANSKFPLTKYVHGDQHVPRYTTPSYPTNPYFLQRQNYLSIFAI